jgi:arylsulfatase A-like enzyme
MLGGLWSCTDSRPNILLITAESVRPDFLSCYSSAHRPTPHIDALADSGVLFTQAVCDAPWTRASMTSVMTGQHPPTHGLHSPYQRVPDNVTTMAEVFRAAGYQTGAVVGAFDLDQIFEIDHGFEKYDDRFHTPQIAFTKRPLHVASVFYGDPPDDRTFRRRKLRNDSVRGDQETTEAAIGQLHRLRSAPFLLWVHYAGTRQRWLSATPLGVMMLLYQPSVSQLDEEVGRLLQELTTLGLERNTVVVFHADEGLRLVEHPYFGKGETLYEADLRVPLLMRWPNGLPAGRRVQALVRLIDLFPTLTELARLRTPAALEGRSLLPLIRGTQGAVADHAYCETFLSATIEAGQLVKDAEGKQLLLGFVRRGIRTERWKYLRNEPLKLIDLPSPEIPQTLQESLRTEELYDLSGDPDELHNLVSAEPAVAAQLRTQLSHYLSTRSHTEEKKGAPE